MWVIEFLALITGVVSVYLTIKQNILCWLFGMISCSLLLVSFVNNECYGQSIYQTIGMFQCLIGWYRWKSIDNVEITSMLLPRILITIPLLMFLGVIFTVLTHPNLTNHWLYLDGVSSFISLFGTYLMIMKRIQTWWVFMISNVFSIILCLHQELYFIVGLNVLLFLLSINGYKEWKRNIKMV